MKNTIITIILIIAFTSSANANVKTDFFERLVKMTKGSADDIVKRLSKPKVSKGTKEALSKNLNYPKLVKAVKDVPEKAILANKAENIIKKGDFEQKFFIGQNFDNQLTLIVQSSKYGNKYFKVAQDVSSVTPDMIAHNSYLIKQLPQRALNPKILQSKYIETLEKTGKYGWHKLQKIGSWVAKHPKTSAAGGAYAWYVLDPVGFEEQLKNSGKDLSNFLMTTVGSTVGGVGEAVTEKTEEIKDEIKQDFDNFIDEKVENVKASTSYIISRVVGILILILLFIAWRKRKIIQNFLTKADEVEEINNEKDDDEF